MAHPLGMHVRLHQVARRSTYDAQMSDAQDHAAEALEEVADALRDARLAFHVAEDLTRATLKSNTRGVPDAAVLRANPVVEGRRPVDEALAQLERARHKVLVAIFAVALEDGMTIAELARNYGFSRQLASRYAKEARATRNPE
jgi:hypothetical protein